MHLTAQHSTATVSLEFRIEFWVIISYFLHCWCIDMQGSTLRLLNHLPTGQVPLQFDLPECKIYLPDVVFITTNQGRTTFPEKKSELYKNFFFFFNIFTWPIGQVTRKFYLPDLIFYLPPGKRARINVEP